MTLTKWFVLFVVIFPVIAFAEKPEPLPQAKDCACKCAQVLRFTENWEVPELKVSIQCKESVDFYKNTLINLVHNKYKYPWKVDPDHTCSDPDDCECKGRVMDQGEVVLRQERTEDLDNIDFGDGCIVSAEVDFELVKQRRPAECMPKE